MDEKVRFSEPEVKHSEAETASKQPKVRIVTVKKLRCPYCESERTTCTRTVDGVQSRKCLACNRRFITRRE